MENLFVFADDPQQEDDHYKPLKPTQNWKILIVDDEPEVHKITKLVLNSVEFEDQTLEFLHAYKASEAERLLEEHGHEIAIAFVDVVMETDTAGLDLVRYIRNGLNNHITRIILRTGQPGQAPEESVIKNYDINDYKSKTELTSSKLKTTLYASLRSYRDIISIEQHRSGLQKVLKAIGNTSAETNLRSLTSQLLSQLATVLDLEEDAMYCSVLSTADGQSKEDSPQRFKVLAKAGHLFSGLQEDEPCTIPAEIEPLFKQAHQEKRSIQRGIDYIAYILTANGDENLLYVRKNPPLNQLNLHLLDIFIDNFAKAYAALALKDEVEQSQRELVYILGEAVEVRSKETGSHVKRVGEISYLLAKKYGLSPQECELIKAASPLHDVGKISIPDAIMNKPGKLTPEERAVIEDHAETGYNMLKNSKTLILKMAATIALEHHEAWNGKGYPNGKLEKETHVMSRIAGIADVFDALGSKRCYKEAWSLDKIIEFFKEKSGSQFDPELVGILLSNIDEFSDIRKQFPDPN